MMAGPLPKELGHLCDLQSLGLPGMNLSVELNQLREVFSGCVKNSLEELDLSFSQLTGTLPDWLGEIKNLKSLNLLHNSIYGSIPESLGQLSSLETLEIGGNKLNGTVAENIGQLSSLVTLDLSANSLNAVISKAHFANLKQLKELDLYSNSLALDVASDWVPPFNLEYLALGSCQIGPEFPQWLQTQHKLSYLDLSNAGISDAMPDWFWNLTSQLYFLDLSNNQISSSIPSSLCKSVELQSLSLSNNHLSSVVSTHISSNSRLITQYSIWCYSTKLWQLQCHAGSLNAFGRGYSFDLDPYLILYWNGKEFPRFTNLKFLVIVDLSHNNLSGNIPREIEDLIGLVSLNLSRNHLTGRIPDRIDNLTQLLSLDLSSNALFGEFLEIWPH